MKKNVLLFEKHENLRKLREAMLSKDFSVNTASTPYEIVAWAQTRTEPGAIIANLNSADMDEAATLLYVYRNSGIVSRIPLVLIECGQIEQFRTELAETEIHNVRSASNLTMALRDFFNHSTSTSNNRRMSEATTESMAVPVTLS